jgi:hypothetical protein
VFHDTRERFGGSPLDTRCHIASVCSRAAPSCGRVRELPERGRYLPTAPAERSYLCHLCRLFLCRETSSERLRDPFLKQLALASQIAFPREEAAKAALTTFS